MRRLLVLASTVVFVDTMFFAAIVPLLAGLADEFGLSKGEAGILSGSYAAGTLIAAIPGGLVAARFGPRRTVLVGLSVMTVTGVGFALAQNVVLLDATRFLQGVGGAFSWAGAFGWIVMTAPRERRGEMIGTAMGAAIAGVLAGPALGGLADVIGREITFSAVALLGVGLIALTLTVPPPESAAGSIGGLRSATRSAAVRFGMVLILVPGMVFGAIEVLVPLELDDLGASAIGVAVVFLAAAALEAVVAPLAGRLSDRRGRLVPCMAGLVAAAIAMVVIPLPSVAWLLGVTVVIAAPWIGMLWSPAMAMLADGAEASGVNQGLAFGFVNLGWGLGHTVGAVAIPAFAEVSSNAAAYGALCALSLAALWLLVARRGGVERAMAAAEGFPATSS